MGIDWMWVVVAVLRFSEYWNEKKAKLLLNYTTLFVYLKDKDLGVSGILDLCFERSLFANQW